MANEVTRPQGNPGGDIALVLSGGGARAAYQVGVLRAIVRRVPGANFQIITGVSAGAINAAFLAAHAHSLPEAVESLGRLWSELRAEQVFRVDPVFFARNLLRCRTTAHAASPSGSGRRPRRRRLPPWHAGEEVAMTIAGVVFALMAGSMLVLVVRALRRRLITPRPSPTAPWRPA